MHSCFGSAWETDWTGGPCVTGSTPHLTLSSSSHTSLISHLPPALTIPAVLILHNSLPHNSQYTLSEKCRETIIVQTFLR